MRKEREEKLRSEGESVFTKGEINLFSYNVGFKDPLSFVEPTL